MRPEEQMAPVAALERVQDLCEEDEGDEEQCGVDKGTHDVAPAGELLHRAAVAWRPPGLQRRAGPGRGRPRRGLARPIPSFETPEVDKLRPLSVVAPAAGWLFIWMWIQ